MTHESVPMGRRDSAGDRTAARLQTAPTVPVPLRAVYPTSTLITWGVVGLGFSLIAGNLHRLTIPAELCTLIPGGALLWYALRPATPHLPAPAPLGRRSTMPWVAIAVAFGIWELYAAARGSTHAHPTLSIMMGPLIDPPPARAAGYVVWLLGGVWMVRR